MVDSFHSELQATLGGAYILERELDGGGMSRVFVARDTTLGRRVVVKVLPPELAVQISLDRFRQEIEFAAKLQHPHIVTVLTASAMGDIPYYMMPFVEGESLRQRLAMGGGTLPLSDAVRIAAEVADALAYAHERGIVHRDVKPGNILLSGEHAVVTDFGVARAVTHATLDEPESKEAVARAPLTTTGWRVGTPAYMSPEQALSVTELDGRSDVYSLGCVLYEMLVGSLPFTGSVDQMISARLTQSPERPSRTRRDVPAALDQVVLKALSRDKQHRYPSARAFREALLRVDMTHTTHWWVLKTATWVVAVLAAVAIGLTAYVRLFRSTGSLDDDLVVVAPFYIVPSDPELDRWGEGIADVLSRNIDGAGSLRTASLSSFARQWTQRTDRGSASELARLTSARFVIFGTAIPAAHGSLRVVATVYDAERRQPLDDDVTINTAGSGADMARLTDSLTIALLNQIGNERVIGVARRALLGSSVPPNALKTFVDGERYFRHAAWDSALVSYERAVEVDSTFAVALSRIGLVLSWQRVAADSLARAFALRAGRLNHGLGSRDSLLVLADSISASLADSLVDGAWWSRAKRLLATLTVAAKRYPSDPIVWYALGDARMHYGGPVGVTEREALAAFDSAIAIDSAFSPAYVHPMELALELDGARASQRYVRAYLARGPTDNSAGGARVLSALITGDGIEPAQTRQLLDTASADALFSAWIPLRRWTDSAEVAAQILKILHAGKRASSYALFADTASLRLRLAAQLAFRGHLREAFALAGSDDPRLFAELAELGVVPDPVARATFGRWLREGGGAAVYGLRWWAERRDTISIAAFIGEQQVLRRNDSPSTIAARNALGTVGSAYLAVARQDTTEASRLFASVPDSVCVEGYPARLSEAELIVAQATDTNDADGLRRWYTFPPRTYPTEVLWWLVQGRMAESRGERRAAVERYCAVVAAWVGADAELSEYVRYAQRRAEQLARHSDSNQSRSCGSRRLRGTTARDQPGSTG